VQYKNLTQQLGLSIFDPNLAWNNPAFECYHVLDFYNKKTTTTINYSCLYQWIPHSITFKSLWTTRLQTLQFCFFL